MLEQIPFASEPLAADSITGGDVAGEGRFVVLGLQMLGECRLGTEWGFVFVEVPFQSSHPPALHAVEEVRGISVFSASFFRTRQSYTIVIFGLDMVVIPKMLSKMILAFECIQALMSLTECARIS